MAEERKGSAAAGFSLLWRRQRVLWWIFVVNLLCGGMGALPATLRVGHALNHTLAEQKLSRGFDLAMFGELVRLPDVQIWRFTTPSWLFAFVFFVFMLFVTGGVLETYRADRRLTTGEFFAASGAYFWRFVRLLLLSIIPFVIVVIIYQMLSKAADRIGDRAIADQVGVFLGWGAMAVFLLLALFVRLWFDIAQVRAVAQSERGMWRNTWHAWRITWHGFGRLYGMYFVIALIAWICTAIGLVIWANLPPAATGAVFLILELIMFAQIASRLWQLAGATNWYRGHEQMFSAPVVESVPTPEVQPQPEPVPAPNLSDEIPPNPAGSAPASPSPDPGPELPPADA
jgi:hypothetical protein